MPHKPWPERGQYTAAFNRGPAKKSPCTPQTIEGQNKPKLGLHSGPKPPKFLREEVEREAREKAARDRYLSKYLENENGTPDTDPTLDNSL